MIDRAFILRTLALLEVWLWPVFFWDLYRLDAYLKARRAEGGSGLVGYGVARNGRIYITLDVRGDRKDPCDWTAFAARTPWEKLDPEARAQALMARAGEGFALFVLIAGAGAAMAGQGDAIAGLPQVMVPP
ncbi:hypothetical protein [Henriciella barbarensis]|nr:hypothetical protein [Henriciella barbarensis]